MFGCLCKKDIKLTKSNFLKVNIKFFGTTENFMED